MSNKLKITTTERYILIITLITLVVSACGIFYLLSSYNAVSSSIPKNSEEKRKYSEGNIKNTVRGLAFEKDISTTIYQKAKDEDKNTVNTYIKDKRDLYAQEGMWKVATELLWVTTLQLFFFIASIIGSFIGLYFLYKTLSATAETNAIVRRTSNFELQPYVAIKSMSVTINGLISNEPLIIFSLKIKNDGLTPMKGPVVVEVTSSQFTYLREGSSIVHIDSMPLIEEVPIPKIVELINPRGKRHVKWNIEFFSDATIKAPISTPFEALQYSICFSVKFKDISTDGTKKHREVKFESTNKATMKNRFEISDKASISMISDNLVGDESYIYPHCRIAFPIAPSVLRKEGLRVSYKILNHGAGAAKDIYLKLSFVGKDEPFIERIDMGGSDTPISDISGMSHEGSRADLTVPDNWQSCFLMAFLEFRSDCTIYQRWGYYRCIKHPESGNLKETGIRFEHVHIKGKTTENQI